MQLLDDNHLRSPNQISRVKDVLDQLRNALQTKNSDAAIEAFHSENVMFTLAPPLQNVSGSSPGKKGIDTWLASWEQGPNISSKDQNILMDEKSAVAYGLVHMTGKKRMAKLSIFGIGKPIV